MKRALAAVTLLLAFFTANGSPALGQTPPRPAAPIALAQVCVVFEKGFTDDMVSILREREIFAETVTSKPNSPSTKHCFTSARGMNEHLSITIGEKTYRLSFFIDQSYWIVVSKSPGEVSITFRAPQY